MKITITQNENTLNVAMEGRLDTETAPQLEAEIKPYLSQVNEIVYDCEKLDYITSAGLRIMLFAHTNMHSGGVSIVRNANPVVKEVFEITGLSNLLQVE